jgi:beta-lactamase superfamily II metal-dependent hydrolase
MELAYVFLWSLGQWLLYHSGGGWYFLGLLILVYPLRRWWKPMVPLYVGWGIIGIIFLIQNVFMQPTYRVVQAQPNYVVVERATTRYYISQPETLWEIGDHLICPTSPKKAPLRMTTYEGTFDFASYLSFYHVQTELHCDWQIASSSWFRPLTWKTNTLSSWQPSAQPYVSAILWDDNLSSQPGLDSLYLLSISGLGWWTLLHVVDAFFKPLLRDKHHRLGMTVFVFLYGGLMITEASLFRVSMSYLIPRWVPKSLQPWAKRFGYGVYMVLFPFAFLQTGFFIYACFVLYYRKIVPMIPSHPWLNKISFLVFVYSLQAVFFQHIVFLQPLLLPLWLLLLPPLWIGAWFATVWVGFQKGWETITRFVFSRLTEMASLSPVYYVRPFDTLFLVLGLILLLLWVWSLRKHVFPWFKVFTIVTILFVFVTQTAWETWVYPFRIHFINVGQGDATLITIQQKTILIDTGGSLYRNLASDVLMPYFRRQGIQGLNHVIITHDDFDHGGALTSLQEQIPIGEIHRFEFSQLHGPSWQLKNLNLWQDEAEEDNENSLILWFQYASCRVLITGDASVALEERLLFYSPLRGLDVLRIGHHGSNTSTSDAFLKWTQPRYAVISVGGGNRYGHPHAEVIDRLNAANIPIFRTDFHGTIVMNSCTIKP